MPGKHKERFFLIINSLYFWTEEVWADWVQKVATTDEVPSLTVKFKLKSLKKGIFISPLMSFSMGKIELNLLVHSEGSLSEKESSKPAFTKSWKTQLCIGALNDNSFGLSSLLSPFSLLASCGLFIRLQVTQRFASLVERLWNDHIMCVKALPFWRWIVPHKRCSICICITDTMPKNICP